VKDEKGDLVADSQSIVARWRNYFSQLFNVHGVKDFRQAEIHTAEPLVPKPSSAEFELAIDKLKSHKSPVIDQIWKKEKLPEEWKEPIIIPIHKKGIKQVAIIIEAYHFCQPLTKFDPKSCRQG